MVAISKPMAPDEKAFRANTSTGRFSAGVDANEWRLVSIDWPHATIAIAAVPREGAPSEYCFRFELSGYPNTAATAQVWNADEGRIATADERPKVAYSPSPFRCDWLDGTALYIPCDRLAVQGHSDWPAQHAGELWDPAKGISQYLLYVHRLLHDDAYAGL